MTPDPPRRCAQPIVPPVDLAREPWRLLAACAHHPTLTESTWDDHLTEEREHPARRAERVATAIAVCNTCPVRLPCLRDVNLEWDSGIRGGIDLRTLKAKKRRAS